MGRMAGSILLLWGDKARADEKPGWACVDAIVGHMIRHVRFFTFK